ncbi:hypothetical protein SprV_0702371100 [Sparganum proliferum]
MGSPEQVYLDADVSKSLVGSPLSKRKMQLIDQESQVACHVGRPRADRFFSPLAASASRGSEMKNLITRINKSLRNLRAKGAITPNDWFSMKLTDTATARFYGLPKVHKVNVPLRPIVSLRGTPTYALAKWVFGRLKFLAEGSPTTVASANQFLERIEHLKLEPDESMVSFDVVSLFTSIPQQLSIDVVDQLLADRFEERDKPLKSEHLLDLL